MSNHFHLLIRVPHRPAGFDLSFDEVLGRWQAAVGDAWQQGMQRQFEIFRQNGSEAAIEEWRQRMLGRMFCLHPQAVQSGSANFAAAVAA